MPWLKFPKLRNGLRALVRFRTRRAIAVPKADQMTVTPAARAAMRHKFEVIRTRQAIADSANAEVAKIAFASTEAGRRVTSPHGSINGINIRLNEIFDRLGENSQIEAELTGRHAQILDRLQLLRRETNVLQLQFTEGRYVPLIGQPGVRLPYADEILATFKKNPATISDDALAQHFTRATKLFKELAALK